VRGGSGDGGWGEREQEEDPGAGQERTHVSVSQASWKIQGDLMIGHKIQYIIRPA
jgi:hypothetical protein